MDPIEFTQPTAKEAHTNNVHCARAFPYLLLTKLAAICGTYTKTQWIDETHKILPNYRQYSRMTTVAAIRIRMNSIVFGILLKTMANAMEKIAREMYECVFCISLIGRKLWFYVCARREREWTNEDEFVCTSSVAYTPLQWHTLSCIL